MNKEIIIKDIEIKNFIYKEVLPQMKLLKDLPEMSFDVLTTENIDEVYDYIVANYEITYIETKDDRLKFIDKVFNYLEQFMEFN